MFWQLQRYVCKYRFANTRDVGRYDVNSKTQDVVVGVRELDPVGLPTGKRNCVDDHTAYTRGFVSIAAYGNQRSVDGTSVFYGERYSIH